MAKTESTAVNQLISLVQTATPLKPDPSEDLMFKSPDRAAKRAARMTSTIPSIKTEVPPLPRTRAPQGTQRGVPIVGDDTSGHAPAKPSVRMSTASQSMTMPAVQPWHSAEGTGETDVITDIRNEALATTMPATAAVPALPDPRATRPSLPPPQRQSSPPPLPRLSAALRTEAPPTTPVAAPFVTSAPVASAAPPMIGGYPSAAPYLAHAAADMTSHAPWFDEAPPNAAVEEIEVNLGTDRIHTKPTDWKALIPKLIAPTLGLIIVGMFVGGYLAFDGQDKPSPGAAVAAKASAPAKIEIKIEPKVVAEQPKVVVEQPKVVVEQPKPEIKLATPEPTTPPNLAPHAATITQDVKTSVVAPVAAHPTFVDIRLDSTPSGATVTLIDRGKSTFLGSTPISTALDPSRQYDIVFSHASKPTQVEHLDPATTKRLAVVLGKTTKPAAASKLEVKKAIPKVEAPKQAEAPKKVETEAPKVEAPKTETKKVVDPFETTPKVDGLLMVSSKPPCEILVDGVATGLTTPQRAIKLTPGVHKITLVNTAEKIKKTVSVTVTADQPTKVIENFMK